MKKIYNNVKEKTREWWNKVMSSRNKKMSQGAQEVNKLITSAHKDQWRRDHGHSPEKKKQ